MQVQIAVCMDDKKGKIADSAILPFFIIPPDRSNSNPLH